MNRATGVPRLHFSYHHASDEWRASQLRHLSGFTSSVPCSDDEWVDICLGGDISVKRWIAEQLGGVDCLVVLIGPDTAARRWITYEIVTAWNQGLGVFGIHIHQLPDRAGLKALQGRNPFCSVMHRRTSSRLSSIAKVYHPPEATAEEVRAYCQSHIARWAADAVATRRCTDPAIAAAPPYELVIAAGA